MDLAAAVSVEEVLAAVDSVADSAVVDFLVAEVAEAGNKKKIDCSHNLSSKK